MRIELYGGQGYIELVESWGSDERIVEAARMSTGKGFLGWGPKCRACGDSDDTERDCPQPAPGVPFVDCGRGGHYFDAPGDEKLLRFLWENKHATPFEMAGATIEVKAPIMVFREWHRHRTQCLGPDTLIHFESPKSIGDRHYVYKMRIEDVWKKWQPTERKDRPERQTNALFPRSRIQGMLLRCLDEEGKEIVHTRIVDVIKGDPKPMVRVTTASGRSLVATREHRVMTSVGWATLGDALASRAPLTLEGMTRGKASRWEVASPGYSEHWLPVAGWEREYEVSNHGRVRRVGCEPRKITVGAQQYDVVSMNRPGEQVLRTVHSLVASAFIGPIPSGTEVRHKNNNRADNTAGNLIFGTSKDNSRDMVEADRQQRLVPVFEDVVSVVEMGDLPTYDLAVQGPWHNFIADGFVVHNSYNEMSARYIPLPDENYLPTLERCKGDPTTSNKQAQGTTALGTDEQLQAWREELAALYAAAQAVYEGGLAIGVPKEIARLPVPVARYSRMRASANLRNWFGFLALRDHAKAQWEIREPAHGLAQILASVFPRSTSLFQEGRA